MRDYLEVVARPKGVHEINMPKPLVCRTSRKVEPLDPSHPNFLANLERARETAKALDWDEVELPDFGEWELPRPARTRGEGFVYFVRAGRTNHVKIGWAKSDVEKRVRGLQCGCPHQLHLIAYVPGTLLDECEWHRRFADCRVRGEWFVLSYELRMAINCLFRTHPGAVSFTMLSILGRLAIGSPFWPDGTPRAPNKD
jgi:hypothetical protein